MSRFGCSTKEKGLQEQAAILNRLGPTAMSLASSLEKIQHWMLEESIVRIKMMKKLLLLAVMVHRGASRRASRASRIEFEDLGHTAGFAVPFVARRRWMAFSFWTG